MVTRADGDVRLVAACLAIIGLMVVGVSVLGCAGGQLESKCLLMFVSGFFTYPKTSKETYRVTSQVSLSLSLCAMQHFACILYTVFC